MKRLIALTILTFAIAASAASIWTVKTAEEANAFTKPQEKALALNVAKLASRDYATYAELKQFAAANEIKLTNSVVPGFVWYQKQAFAADMIKDAEIPYRAKGSVICSAYDKGVITANDLMTMAPEILKDTNDSTLALRLVKQLEKTDADEKALLACLKKCRRFAYPKISASDGWKKVNVQIELLIKAIEP